MRTVALCLLLAAACVAVDLAHQQEDVLGLLYRVTEPLNKAKFPDLYAKVKGYKPSDHLSDFSDGGAAVKEIDSKIADGSTLPQRHIFSLFNKQDRHCALMIVDVLLHSNDWDTAVKSAAFYRQFMNEGAFVYAVYTSVIHAPIAAHVVLPPLYEVTPHLFTNSEVIQKAYTAKMVQKPGQFPMDFTGSKKNPEQRVAYFGEDIGMNVHHVSWHMDYPFWWEEKFGPALDRKGELFFWAHHQLTARFDAERLSNHLSPVDELYWNQPIVEGFAPHTTYKYGGEFPARPDNKDFEDVRGVVRIRDLMIMEERIRDAIAHGYVYDKEGHHIDIRNEKGIEILGDLIESSTCSKNAEYYGSLHNYAHITLGRQADPKGKFNQPPGVMEHFETATRDPAFFRLHKYMDSIFKEHKDSLPPYEKAELEFPAVAINSVAVSGSLETYFESYEFDISQAVDSSANLQEVTISALVDRLNHKDFEVSIDLVNNNGGNVLTTIRTYLCPRYDNHGVAYKFDEARWACIEMDKFWKNLNPGSNTIVRKSSEASTTVPDIPSFKTLLDQAKSAIASGSELHMEKFERSCGIPNRMLLPKSTESGTEYHVVVVATDGFKDAAKGVKVENLASSHAQCGVHGEVYPDMRPLGFPLDRRINDEKAFLDLPNVHKGLVVIKHIGKA